ncbi:MAG: chromosomal replication initiator protein DnaA [Pseudomonadota bacterium]
MHGTPLTPSVGGTQPSPASSASGAALKGRTAPSTTPAPSTPSTPLGLRDNGSSPLANQAGPTVSAGDVQKWERVQAQLKARLGPEAYASWFGRCRLETISKSQLTISVPTTFLKSWIKTHYSTILLTLWQKQAEDIMRVDVVVRSAVRSANSETGEAAKPHAKTHARTNVTTHGSAGQQQIGSALNQAGIVGVASTALGGQCFGSAPGLAPAKNTLAPQRGASATTEGYDTSLGMSGVGFAGSPLDPNFTFATLVEGASNRMAVAAARSVAEADGAAARFNPLFIHADVGLGKTHLLQAIAWAAQARNGNMKILYLTAEYFMWRFASAIRDQSALSFKESLRDIDLLLIDDMQFLQGKSIQQEFCHLLNALIDSAKQVVVAADRPPSELESLDNRVRSRLKGGVALEVKGPDLEMRETMMDLRYREAQREDPELDIPADVLSFVAQKVASSGRDLEGAFNQLLIQHRFSEGPVEIEVIEKMLGHLVQSGEQKRVRIEDIQKVTARHYNVSKNDLLSNRRTRVIVRPRQIAMYLSKILTPRSLPEIGRRFGGRDHTTVLHAVRKIEGLLKEDTKLAHEIELLKRLIHELG